MRVHGCSAPPGGSSGTLLVHDPDSQSSGGLGLAVPGTARGSSFLSFWGWVGGGGVAIVSMTCSGPQM